MRTRQVCTCQGVHVTGVTWLEHDTVLLFGLSGIHVSTLYSLPAKDAEDGDESYEKYCRETHDQCQCHLAFIAQSLFSYDGISGKICNVTNGVSCITVE